jgi:hypothetical protein
VAPVVVVVVDEREAEDSAGGNKMVPAYCIPDYNYIVGTQNLQQVAITRAFAGIVDTCLLLQRRLSW